MMPEDEDAVILARATEMEFWVLVVGELVGWILTMGWVIWVVPVALAVATLGWLALLVTPR